MQMIPEDLNDLGGTELMMSVMGGSNHWSVASVTKPFASIPEGRTYNHLDSLESSGKYNLPNLYALYVDTH
jgi:hypothetical protein